MPMNLKLEPLSRELAQAQSERNRLTVLWAAYRLFLSKEITHHEYLSFTRQFQGDLV